MQPNHWYNDISTMFYRYATSQGGRQARFNVKTALILSMCRLLLCLVLM